MSPILGTADRLSAGEWWHLYLGENLSDLLGGRCAFNLARFLDAPHSILEAESGHVGGELLANLPVDVVGGVLLDPRKLYVEVVLLLVDELALPEPLDLQKKYLERDRRRMR